MNRFSPKVGSEPYIIETVTIRLHTDGMNGGTEFDRVVARNVAVELIYTYTPGEAARNFGHPDDMDDGVPAELTISAIRTSAPAWFDSESGAVLSFTVGSCIQHIMDERDIEALEEELLKKLEGK